MLIIGSKVTKLFRRVGNALGSIGGNVAGSLGYGRRRVGRPRPVGSGMRRRRVRRRGGSLRSVLSKVHGFGKSNQLVSKGLSHFGHPKLASVASSLGYGLRRRRPYGQTSRRCEFFHHITNCSSSLLEFIRIY